MIDSETMRLMFVTMTKMPTLNVLIINLHNRHTKDITKNIHSQKTQSSQQGNKFKKSPTKPKKLILSLHIKYIYIKMVLRVL